jgi:hypothetical protein
VSAGTSYRPPRRRRRRESVVVLVFIGVVPVLVGIIFVLVGVVSVPVDGVPVLLPPAESCSPHAHVPAKDSLGLPRIRRSCLSRANRSGYEEPASVRHEGRHEEQESREADRGVLLASGVKGHRDRPTQDQSDSARFDTDAPARA